MPTKERTAEAAEEIADKLDRLGFSEITQEGPIEIQDEDSVSHQHFIYANKQNTVFYFQLMDEYEFANVVYSYNVAKSIGSQLEDDEVQQLAGQGTEDEIDEDILEEAGVQIIEQTPKEALVMSKFNLAAYATTALVNYKEKVTENGFPARFQCIRSVFPYDGDMSLRELDDRVETTLTAGDRGARYVESALFIERGEEQDPSDYIVSPQF
jgi:hypothetical protein